MPHNLMLFAAGRGTRMGALTADRPKPMLPVAGRPLIDHALGVAAGGGVGRVVVNLHYLPALLRAHLAGRPGVVLAEEETLLETGGGLKNALPLLGPGPVFTLNSDVVWSGPNPVATLRAAWRPDRMDALLLLVPLAAARGHAAGGDATLHDDGRMSWGGAQVYTGAQIIRTEALSEIAERAFPMRRLWDVLMSRGRMFGVAHPGGWADAGNPQGLETAAELLEARDHG